MPISFNVSSSDPPCVSQKAGADAADLDQLLGAPRTPAQDLLEHHAPPPREPPTAGHAWAYKTLGSAAWRRTPRTSDFLVLTSYVAKLRCDLSLLLFVFAYDFGVG